MEEQTVWVMVSRASETSPLRVDVYAAKADADHAWNEFQETYDDVFCPDAWVDVRSAAVVPGS